MDSAIIGALIGGGATIAAAVIGIVWARRRDSRTVHGPEREAAPSALAESTSSRIERTVLQPLNTIDREIATLEGVSIRCSAITISSLESLTTDIGAFTELVLSELRSHPVLHQIDYESLPIPLKNGFFAIVSKLQTKLYIEAVFRSAPDQNLLELWKALATQYFVAYRLAFRLDGSVLARPSEFARSYDAISRLFELVQRYTTDSKIWSDPLVASRFHKLKGGIAFGLQTAEKEYRAFQRTPGDRKLLGRVVLALDSAISCAHKILIEYQPPQ